MTERKQRFIKNLRMYSQTIVGSFDAAEESHDRQRVFSELFTEAYRSAAFWFQRPAIDHYDKSDWKDLSEENQKELDECVSKFADLVDRTTPMSNPSKSDCNQALPVFLRICELTESNTNQ